jgi:hypothetical protein
MSTRLASRFCLKGSLPMTKYSIMASRAELAKALALAAVGVRKGINFEIRFSLKDGLLDIMGPGAAHSLPAQGLWPSPLASLPERTFPWSQSRS